jgi:hypothetical protein
MVLPGRHQGVLAALYSVSFSATERSVMVVSTVIDE